MILNIILWVLSIIVSFGLYFLLGLYQYLYLIFIPIILIPIIYALLFGLLLLVLLIIGLFINTKKELKKPSKVCYFFTRQVNYLICKLSRTKIHIKNKERMVDESCLIVTNHISNFDPMVLMAIYMKKKIICITKPENLRIPICGPFIYKSGFIPINRTNTKEALGSVKKAIDVLENHDCSVSICPEGTRSKTGELLPFHGGSFKIAMLSKKPIVVISIKNTNLIHKNFPWKRTRVYMNVVSVYSYEDYKEMNSNELAEKVRNDIEKDLKGE